METGMARKIQSVKVWTLALTVAGTVATAAQQPAPAQPGGAEPAAQAAGPQPQRVDTYIVGQAKPPVEPGTGLKDMTLEQAIEIALENNLDLKVAKMNPQIQDYALVQSRAVFRPTVTASFNQNHASQPNTDVTQVVSTVLTQ